ncbi:MAG: CbiX/SirB N-terminal domain-containing protein [Anaerolineae bacterium]|nr:CbiX/SirB N-terminal domain-containing protein [Anaerolineae bacterium]MDW8070709.1 CbiX/SirB N-terminal domain-containing protein [Anaerolineae bacterium]
MKTIIVLAMHGALPDDFPRHELDMFFSLRAQFKRATPEERSQLEEQLRTLERRIRTWPRTAANDPFYAASQAIGTELSRLTGREVIVAFNEFCAPDVGEGLELAVQRGARRIIVLTPMLTRGGDHAEKEIPAAIEHARQRYPEVTFVYAWPFADKAIARFLADQIARFDISERVL